MSDWDIEIRPHLTPYFAYAAAALILAAHVAVGVLLKISSTGVIFQTADQVAIALLGAVIAGAVLLFARPRLRVGAGRRRGAKPVRLQADPVVGCRRGVVSARSPLGQGGPARRRVHPGDGDPGRRQGSRRRRDGPRARAAGALPARHQPTLSDIATSFCGPRVSADVTVNPRLSYTPRATALSAATRSVTVRARRSRAQSTAAATSGRARP